MLGPDGLEEIVAALAAGGRWVIAPVVRDGTLMLDDIASAAELPWGVRDEQNAGRYSLGDGTPTAAFGTRHGPQSWKQFVFPPRELLWRARRDGGGFELDPASHPPAQPVAFLGVRPCDLAALGLLDTILGASAHPDAGYVARRASALVVAVQCTRPGGTCFCTSMQTGPRAGPGADLVLTELDEAEPTSLLLAEARTDAGAEVLAAVEHRAATDDERAGVDAALTEAEGRMGRTLVTDGLVDVLRRTHDSARWEAVAERCLSCASCTLVCPSCFCSTIEDVTDLTGDHTERWLRWDSCFTADHSYLHGGAVRGSTASRYRQWLTHKLGTWHDQFGTSGCVGCGRCITWCPVAIDLTEEAAALQEEAS